MQPFDPNPEFNLLSIKDLLEARELFHVHLMNKRNVVATAIGRYFVRRSGFDRKGNYHPEKAKGKRTLSNSLVTKFSWPCIIVFVQVWEDAKALAKRKASDVIPKNVYMPDGRIIPICVVEAPRLASVSADVNLEQVTFPSNLIGGGFPLTVESQGVERIASIGCIVSDGHTFYALTNKHVTGDDGVVINSKFGDEVVEVGRSSSKMLGKVNFATLYPNWGKSNVQVNCDAGLIEINNMNRWKTDVLGIGQIGEPVDLNAMTINLSLISQHDFQNGKEVTLNSSMVGHGAISGDMQGELLALFYRYKNIGGIEYVSDFLIGGANGEDLNVKRGDSGTLWMLKEDNSYRPFGLHWGQHEFLDGNNRGRYSYSLASNLTSICRELDVDVVRAWNLDSEYSWGKVGHYTVGTAAIAAIGNKDLKKLMTNNLKNISFDRQSIITTDFKNKKKVIIQGLSSNPTKGYCALADVPDIIWKQTFSDKAKWGRKGDENPNHYADVDAPTTNGETLFDLCDTPDKLTTKVWMDYYNNINKEETGITKSDPNKYGLVSFRVWQIFDYAVKALKADRMDKFIFATGVMAHYVGDSCQPLHSSYMSNGDPKEDTEIDYTAKVTSHKKNGEISHRAGDVYKKTVNPGNGVHGAYEDEMVDDHIDDILEKLFSMIANKSSKINKEAIPDVNSGQEAGFETLMLMKKTQETIRPVDIIDSFKKAKKKGDVSEALYDDFGSATIECMARGSRYLAAIWEGAWKLGNGNAQDLKAVPQKKLITLYSNRKELPSMRLATVDQVLK